MEESTHRTSLSTEFQAGTGETATEKTGKSPNKTPVIRSPTRSPKPGDSSLLVASRVDSDHESILTEEIKAISVAALPIHPIEDVYDAEQYPPSYKTNCEKELKAIQYIKTFIKQYNFLYNRRQPLFIKPKNEFGVQKLVCTTIKPGQLPYKDLLDWPDISNFVAGYVNYDPLSLPHMLPKTLFAPQTILEKLHGHCFDMSTLLCSMLIGAGYDAFVVSGYATREVCQQDLSYTKCPFVEDDLKVFLPPKTLTICRYRPRAPRLFRSEYELRMNLVKWGKEKVLADAVKAEEERSRMLREAPPPDELQGWRIHSWVMVLAGLRGVKDTFFIEPSTGVPHPTNWEEYLGIESLWNHKNYYINVQYDKIGEGQKLWFDIGNSCNWEYLFPGQDLHLTLTEEEKEQKYTRIAKLGDHIDEEKHLDLPFSWTLPLNVNRYDYDRQFPTGKQTRKYKKSIVDDYCRYMDPDGLVKKVTVYHDLKWEHVWYIKETFADRADLLESRFFHVDTKTVIENFKVGREDFVREHRYHAEKLGPENWHLILYEPGKRVDELYKREAGSTFLKNYYQGRTDKKKYTGYTFGPRGNITERLALPTSRAIEEIVEEFDRNPEKPANDDVATVIFSTWSDEISIQYHTSENRFYGSTRDFLKPQNWWDDTHVLQWTPDLHSNFELDQFAEPKTELQLYQMLIALMETEGHLRNSCRLMEKEVGKFLQLRAKETSKENRLVKTFLQADEDEAIRADRLKEKAQRRAAAILKKSDVLKDYLEPIICSLGLDKVTNRKQAIRVKDDCMLALKDRLVSQAAYIKDRFEKERNILETTQMWYRDHFPSMSQQDVLDCRHFMLKHMFTANILEQRLAHLKVYALVRYQELFDKLRQDPRLEPYLI